MSPSFSLCVYFNNVGITRIYSLTHQMPANLYTTKECKTLAWLKWWQHCWRDVRNTYFTSVILLVCKIHFLCARDFLHWNWARVFPVTKHAFTAEFITQYIQIHTDTEKITSRCWWCWTMTLRWSLSRVTHITRWITLTHLVATGNPTTSWMMHSCTSVYIFKF